MKNILSNCLKSKAYIYRLKFRFGNEMFYYVGKTENIENRVQQHLHGQSSDVKNRIWHRAKMMYGQRYVDKHDVKLVEVLILKTIFPKKGEDRFDIRDRVNQAEREYILKCGQKYNLYFCLNNPHSLNRVLRQDRLRNKWLLKK